MGIKSIEMEENYLNAVTLEIRKKGCNFKVSLDVKVTPIYCMECNRCLPDLYEHVGSRYGIVGELYCDSCDSKLAITDHDNIVDRLHVSVGQYIDPWINNLDEFDKKIKTITIEYSEVYLINQQLINDLVKLHRYDIEDILGKWMDLADFIKDIKMKLNIDDQNIMKTNAIADTRFNLLPLIIADWYNLIYHLGLVIEKDGVLIQ